MIASPADLYSNDPMYLSMMSRFQNGEWEAGIKELNQLIEKYPLEHDLRYLRQEMQLRSKMDQYEKVDRRSTRAKYAIRAILLGALGLAALVTVVWAVVLYARWFRDQIDVARQRVEFQLNEYDLNNQFNNAQQFLASYRPDEALVILQQIQASKPTYPGLEQALQTAQEQQVLAANYDEAMQQFKAGDHNAALAGLLAIEAQNPGYRDVSLQIKEIQRAFSMDDMIRNADEALLAGKWEEAISGYEEVRGRDPLYRREDVEDRLYNSYLNAATSQLDQNPDSLDALQAAREYFSKALSLRPQDQKVIEEMVQARETVATRLFNKYIDLAQQALVEKSDSLQAMQTADQYLAEAQKIRPDDPAVSSQRKLAQAFLAGIAAFNEKKWDEAITNLQYIYTLDVDYAAGTARQTLYDAFVARGDKNLLNGKLQSAQEDYQEAVSIAELRPDSQLRLFEVQVRIGDLLGVLGNYEAAVFQYRSALELANISEIVNVDPDIATTLFRADNYVQRRKFKNAHSLYHEAMVLIAEKFQSLTYIIEQGDYLTQLANQYETTVSAILSANKLADPSELSIGQRIIIPVLPSK